MIVSASRRTDIPALFSQWFYNRLEKGFVLLRNPYNPMQAGRVDLTPDRVDGFVFWTKNAAPMLENIHKLDAFQYYFQYTITPYGRDVERNLPDKHEVIIPAFQRLGADKAVWRYDPVFINERYTVDYHIRAFTKLCEELEGCNPQGRHKLCGLLPRRGPESPAHPTADAGAAKGICPAACRNRGLPRDRAFSLCGGPGHRPVLLCGWQNVRRDQAKGPQSTRAVRLYGEC